MKHISQYFEPVRGFLGTHPEERVSVAVINRVLKNKGCPDEWIDSVVNGVIAELLVNNIAPMENSVQTFDRDGNEMPDVRISPTRTELIDILTQKQFCDLETDRAERLIDFLIQKSVLKESGGQLYRGVLPPRGLPIQL